MTKEEYNLLKKEIKDKYKKDIEAARTQYLKEIEAIEVIADLLAEAESETDRNMRELQAKVQRIKDAEKQDKILGD